MKKLKLASKNEIAQIEDAWLNIGIRDEYIKNPLKDIPEAAISEPYIFFSYMMGRPHYFAAFCKYVMNIDMLPFQSVIQSNLYNYKFPMLIASRGGSKSWSLGLYCLLRMIFMPNRKIIVCGAGFRQSKLIFEYMDAFYQNAPLLRDMLQDKKVGGFKDTDMWRFLLNGGYTACLPVGCVTEDTYLLTSTGVRTIRQINEYQDKVWGNGDFRDTGFFFNNGISNTIKIITGNGYEFQCTPNHKLRSLSLEDNTVNWVRADKLGIGDRLCIDNQTKEYEEKDQDKKELDLLFSVGEFRDFGVYIFPEDKKLTQFKLLNFGCVSKVTDSGLFVGSADYARFLGKRHVEDYFIDYINNIDEGIKLPTFDINVPEGNEYFANGFYSHNTGDKIRGQRANDLICLTKDTLIQTDKGLIEIKDYLDGNEYLVMNKDQQFEKPKYVLVTDPTDVYEVTTRNGFSFKCSNVHQVMTSSGWKKAIDLTTEDRLVIDSNSFFPAKTVSQDGLEITDDMGWLLGLLISEGELGSRNTISVTNTDKELIDKVKTVTGYDWKEYEREPYIDKRGFSCKRSWTIKFNCTDMRETLYKMGVNYCIHKDKTIPSCILKSPRSVVVKFLSGLFEGDGTALQYEDGRNKKKKLRVAYYSRSKKLCQQLQVLLLKFNVYGALCFRKSNLSEHKQWILQFNGENALSLYNLLDVGKWRLDNSDLVTNKKTPNIRKNGDRLIVSTWNGGNVHIGTFDTEEECVEAFNKYWAESRKSFVVKSVTKLDEREVLYDFNMPETHSFIGNGFVQHNCDEFSSINPAIFETVMAGFAAVSSDPVGNAKRAAARKEAEKLGIELEFDTSKDIIKSNQIVISGTAYYSFNHFASYWRRWKAIINSRDDPRGLEEHYPTGIPKDLNPDDYSIIRIPVELIPEDFMDMGQIARTKGSINAGVYANEYGAVFSADSDGFFRRTLIESCIAHEGKIFKNKEDCYFEPRIYGDPDLQYVMGIDPASENDNFSIVLLELHKDHRRLVYSWTTTRKNHQARLKNKLVDEHDFYSYVNRKVRNLMERFNVVHIIIDSQGGGYAVIEAFKNEGNMKEYERPILEVRDPNKPKDSDRREGHHIVELASFADAKWFSEANHGMKKDMEEQELIFPSFDPASLALAIEEDQLMDRVVDTVQDCVEEIELLKDELCTIVMKQTMSGREQFVTPEEVTNGSKRRQKKDRYSSLVIANMAARIIQNDDTVKIKPHIGGFAGKVKAGSGPMYYGNEVYNAIAKDCYKDY